MKNIADGTRLYINITNACNTNCPFCCMYSGTDKNRYMNFSTYKDIIDSTSGKIEVQLEGGEPLLHNDLFLFIEYAISTKRCDKIIILSNGILLEKYLKRLVDISTWNNIKIEFKVSINYWLLKENPDHLATMNKLIFATHYIDTIDFKFNVRKRKHEDNNIEELLKKYKLYDYSNIYYLQSYGKLTNSNEYDKPIIVQNIQNWKIFASDGKCFEQDLIARSEYENK